MLYKLQIVFFVINVCIAIPGKKDFKGCINNKPKYLNELPSNCLQITNQISNCYNGYNNSYGYKKKTTFSTKPSYQNDYEYSTEEYSDYSSYHTSNRSSLTGVRVYHESFGYGKIIDVEGQSCLVDFDKYGRKKIMGTYLRRA